jgi:hypothetical protein
MMISEFEQWLRSRTNQEKRPFHEETVIAYAKAAQGMTVVHARHGSRCRSTSDQVVETRQTFLRPPSALALLLPRLPR